MTMNENGIKELPGVGVATAEKLLMAGFDNLLSIAVASPGQLVEASGVTEATARKIIYAARDKMDMGFESGEDLLKKRQEIIRISTGSQAFDALIGGGFESGSISECFGEFGASKSQIAHVLAINVQKPLGQGGVGGSVIFIDGESTFRPERIIQIANGSGMDPDEVLKNIKVARAFNSDHQMLLAEKSEEIIKEGINGKPVKLMIVDSLTSHFRADFSGRGQLADRQQKLNRHMHTLMKLANQYNLCVYVTNQVMAKPDMFFGDPTTAIGGNIVGHNCLLEGTLIQLPDGRIRKIEEMINEDGVLSVDLSSMKAKGTSLKTIVAKRKDKICKIETTHRIESSLEHRFFTLQEFEIKEMLARDLKQGQYIAHGFNFEIEGNLQKVPEVKQEQLIVFDNEAKELIFDSLSNTREEICVNLEITPRQFRRVLNQGYPTNANNVDLLIEQGVPAEIRKYTKPCYTHKHKWINIPEYIDSDFSQIIGYFLGDGSLDKRSIRFKDERLEVLSFYQKLFKKLFNVDGSMSKVSKKNCYQLSINSKVILDIFDKINMNLFDYMGKSSDICVKAFIKGFFDADGSIDKEGNCYASQKDDKTMIAVQLLLDRLGIRSRIRRRLYLGNWINHLDIRDNSSLRKFMEIGFTARDKQERLLDRLNRANITQEMTPIRRGDLKALIKDFGIYPSTLLRSRKSEYVGKIELQNVVSSLLEHIPLNKEAGRKLNFLIGLLNADLQWEKISKISVENTDKIFYDFGAERMENYIANGFLVHNSQTRIYLRKGKKGTRVAKLIDSPSLPDGEAIFMVTEGGLQDV